MFSKIRFWFRKLWRGVAAAALAVVTAVGGWFGHDAVSQAAVDTVTWTNPTEYTTGELIANGAPEDQLAAVQIDWGPVGGPYNAGSVTVDATVPGAPGSVTIPRSDPGVDRCYVARSKTVSGVFSAPSEPACKLAPRTPQAPSGLAVE